MARRPPRQSGDDHGPRSEPTPRPGGGVRELTWLDPALDAEYRTAVDAVAGRIERSLGPEVFAVRAQPGADGWRPAPWRPALVAWRRSLAAVIREPGDGTTFAVADVRDCYASIAAEMIGDLLGPEAAHAVAVLRRVRDHGVRGLPVGPEPSAILANAALSRLDHAIRDSGVHHLRWVDDMVLWGSPAQIRRALAALAAAAAAVGLELHDGKTAILGDRRELRATALGRPVSSIIAAP
ncbi:MAG: RNA-directed DNA polymerase [Actinomycetota bacterium]